MKELSEAMAAAFSEIENASKDKNNPHFKSKYADLSSVMDAIKPALAKNGLWFRQVMHRVEHGVGIETVIHHKSGESIGCGILEVPATKQDAQGYGSAITYARRYSLQTAFGVAPEDDDGNGAVDASKKKPEGQLKKPAPVLDPHIIDDIRACDSREQLGAIYKGMNEAQRDIYFDEMTARSNALKAAAL